MASMVAVKSQAISAKPSEAQSSEAQSKLTAPINTIQDKYELLPAFLKVRIDTTLFCFTVRLIKRLACLQGAAMQVKPSSTPHI